MKLVKNTAERQVSILAHNHEFPDAISGSASVLKECVEKVKIEVFDDRLEFYGFHIDSQSYVRVTTIDRGSQKGSPISLLDVHMILESAIHSLQVPLDLSETEIIMDDKRDPEIVEKERIAELKRVDKIAEERGLN